MAKNQWNLAHFRTRNKDSFESKLSLSLVWYDLGTTWIGVIDLTHQSVTVDSQTMKVQTENLPYFHNADEEAVRDHERLERDERVIFVTFFFIECINILNVCILCFGNKSLFEGASNIWRFFAPISLSPVESASSQKSRAPSSFFLVVQVWTILNKLLSSPKNRLPSLFIVPLCSLSAFPTKFLQNEEEEREKVK